MLFHFDLLKGSNQSKIPLNARGHWTEFVNGNGIYYG